MQYSPELLAPAGSLEKLKTVVLYGADAVYLSGQKFGLRAAADNFTTPELIEAVEFAHSRQVKVFITMNSFLYDSDLDEMNEFLDILVELKVDAIIASDLGVITHIKNYCHIPIHLSTQASCMNVESALFWKKMGVERIVLGREVSLKEAKLIKEKSKLEIEMFIHGSMCMSYSGNCVISNYTQGRDSNRGGCAHSCRFKYSLDFNQKESVSSYFMSSKDLNGISLLPQYMDAGIDSLKVEGRMKSFHYAGTVTKTYREALDYLLEQKELNLEKLEQWENELRKISHRDYTTASLSEKAQEDSIYFDRETQDSDYDLAGVVIESNPEDNYTILQIRSAINTNDQLELIPFKGHCVNYKNKLMTDLQNNEIQRANPGSLVKLYGINTANEYNLVRVFHQ